VKIFQVIESKRLHKVTETNKGVVGLYGGYYELEFCKENARRGLGYSGTFDFSNDRIGYVVNKEEVKEIK
jgi:hypothetical protein